MKIFIALMLAIHFLAMAKVVFRLKRNDYPMPLVVRKRPDAVTSALLFFCIVNLAVLLCR
jgi:hypothetical protein